MRKFNPHQYHPARAIASCMLILLANACLGLTSCTIRMYAPAEQNDGQAADPPSSLSYSTPHAYITSIAMTPLTPTVTGTVTAFSVSPALPAGLSLNTATGEISGTPSAATAATDYTITATNSGGSTSTTVNFQTGPGFVVDDLGDGADAVPGDSICATAGGDCTVRAAVQEANALGGGTNRLILLPAGTIALDPALASPIDITSNLEVIGASQSATVIDCGATGVGTSYKAFTSASAVTIRISRLRITNSNVAAPNNGAAIRVMTGTVLYLDYVTIDNTHVNGAGTAPALYVANAVAHLSNCTISDNSAPGESGAVTYYISDGSITNCTFKNNSAGTEDGGALAVISTDSLVVSNSLFEGNTAGDLAGAVYMNSSAVGVSFSNVTFSGNTAYRGGAIGGGGTAEFTNVTFANNVATATGGGYGGALDSPEATVSTSWTFKNSLFSVNTYNGAPRNCNDFGSFVSAGNNLSDTPITDCAFMNQPGDVHSGTAALGALQDNSGSTYTHALLGGSQAIDTGTNAGCPATDQRGVARPQNGTCDIGAYEAN